MNEGSREIITTSEELEKRGFKPFSVLKLWERKSYLKHEEKIINIKSSGSFIECLIKFRNEESIVYRHKTWFSDKIMLHIPLEEGADTGTDIRIILKEYFWNKGHVTVAYSHCIREKELLVITGWEK